MFLPKFPFKIFSETSFGHFAFPLVIFALQETSFHVGYYFLNFHHLPHLLDSPKHINRRYYTGLFFLKHILFLLLKILPEVVTAGKLNISVPG